MEWINARLEQPKKSSHSDHSKAVIVFIALNKCQHVATYDHESMEWFCFFSNWRISHVTHWMPLPPAPEVER